MSKILKDGEASKASEASKSGQAKLRKLSKPSDFILPNISFRGSEKRPETPWEPFRGPPSNFGEPREK